MDCRSWGNAVVSHSGVKKDEGLLGDLVEFIKNPVGAIVSAFDMDIRVDFENVGGHLSSTSRLRSAPLFRSLFSNLTLSLAFLAAWMSASACSWLSIWSSPLTLRLISLLDSNFRFQKAPSSLLILLLATSSTRVCKCSVLHCPVCNR